MRNADELPSEFSVISISLPLHVYQEKMNGQLQLQVHMSGMKALYFYLCMINLISVLEQVCVC